MKNETKRPHGNGAALHIAVNFLCVAVILFCSGIAVAAVIFGAATLNAGYPTFGGYGYYYAGDEGIPDVTDGRVLLVFEKCDGDGVKKGDVLIYGGSGGARAGVCLLVDKASGRVVLSVSDGIATVPFDSVMGKTVDENEGAGKVVGALADIYPASSIALFTLAAAVVAIAVIVAAGRRRGKRASRISGQNPRKRLGS